MLSIDFERGTQVNGKNILHLRQAPVDEPDTEQGPHNADQENHCDKREKDSATQCQLGRQNGQATPRGILRHLTL